MLLPYRLTRWVEKHGAPERTFLLVGTGMRGSQVEQQVLTLGPAPIPALVQDY